MDILKDGLAVNGGSVLIDGGLKNRFNIGLQEKEAVMAMFDKAIETGQASGYNGAEEDQLCSDFSDFMGGGYADAVNSGTTAVHVALRALDLEPFSEVIVSPVTDPGGIMPIVMNNCIPVVADAAPGCYNTNAEQIEKRITEHTKAIIVSHIMGEAAEMPAIIELAEKYELKVLEDCAQAHGSKLNGKYVGTFGDVAAFSTMFGKHFNTGGQGGMVFTKNKDIYWRIRQYADRGKPFGLPEGSSNCVASLNFNLSDMSAAIGIVQLSKLKGLVDSRRNLVAMLKEKFSNLKTISVPELPDGSEPSYWFYRLQFNEGTVSCSKAEFLEAVEAEGVKMIKDYSFARPFMMDWFINKKAFGTGGFPWTAPQYKGNYTTEFDCPNVAESLGSCFNLFVYESWGEEEADLIFRAFEKVEKAYSE